MWFEVTKKLPDENVVVVIVYAPGEPPFCGRQIKGQWLGPECKTKMGTPFWWCPMPDGWK